MSQRDNRDATCKNEGRVSCLSDPRRALVYGRFLGILFILSFCHRECFYSNDILNLKSKNSLFFAALKLKS
jgi:hypothetical protein